MNCKIPFTKDILFEKKVCEITSISLEHEIKVEDSTLKGNFIISGDFKSHEVSVNKEAFSYILPFEIELADEVDDSTVEFMIDDFTYEIIDNNILRVNIDFNVIASKKEIEVKEENIFEDASNLFLDVENNDSRAIIEEMALESVGVDEIENEVLDEKKDFIEKNRNVGVQGNNLKAPAIEEESKVSEDTIINSIKNVDNEYAMYHIHMVSDGETVETICAMYNSNLNILAEYNDLTELVSGDKLIIPDKNE